MLELDFVNWTTFKLYLHLSDYEDEADESTPSAERFVADFVWVPPRQPQPMFLQLRTPVLTQVPLVAEMVHTLSFDTLRVLILRMCPGMYDFIEAALGLGVPLQLTTLELRSAIDGREYMNEDFISKCVGLEELFIGQCFLDAMPLWHAIARCHPALRRFVFHQRNINLEEESPCFEEECDLNDLGIVGREVRLLREDPLQNNPLAKLNLDSIGLCCFPGRLVSITHVGLIGKWSSNKAMRQKRILLPYRSLGTLKLLHIRQSASDLKHYASIFRDIYPANPADQNEVESDLESEPNSLARSWADSGPSSPISEPEDATPGLVNEENAPTVESGGWEEESLRPELLRFARWAFGPDGIPSLQAIALGDYAHGRIHRSENFFFVRDTETGRRFRYVDTHESMVGTIYSKYRELLEACPAKPLFID